MFVLTCLLSNFLPLLSVMLLMGEPDEHSTQHSEDVGLNEGHQQLEQVHEEQHEDAEGIQAETESDTH